ncbi:Transposase [Mycetohabitans rhizoxinica HKI 454]|uniref:Transposase n=2 Tax=Mycetohabitans rhizoxinica TaxID=412963 RepID=E5ARR3_MYCRK|nr:MULTISPECIES: transposase [Mycetohabitans]MCG1047325.1 transposase [Mycetohabitans sp. B6]CBW75295.1 Transposase [Mycetohabitans rhizoxinica HKI 454]
MRRHKLSAHQRMAVLDAWKAGYSTSALCKTHGISRATLYLWKQTYTGMSAEAIHRWDALAREHAVLRRQMLREQADRMLLQAVLQALELTVEQKRAMVLRARTMRLSSVSRACQLLRLSRSQFNFDAANDPTLSRNSAARAPISRPCEMG